MDGTTQPEGRALDGVRVLDLTHQKASPRTRRTGTYPVSTQFSLLRRVHWRGMAGRPGS
jgi:hypothetical protein